MHVSTSWALPRNRIRGCPYGFRMARPVPREVWQTARKHARQAHRLRLERSQLGRTNARRDVAVLTWTEGGKLGPVVRCRLCEPGFDRYFADVYAPEPTQRALPRIRSYFAEKHGEAIAPAEIYSRRARPAEPKAT